MQVVMNDCFLLRPEKNLTQIHLVFFGKKKKKNNSEVLQIPKKMMSSSWRLGYSNNQFNWEQIKSQFQASGNHLIKIVSKGLNWPLTC